MYEYEIGGKKYIQKPLVWGQVKQMRVIVSRIKFGSDFEPAGMMDLLGDNVPSFCAIVLREEGQNLVDKNLEALTSEFEEKLDVGTSIKVLEDFFVCNPIDLISKSLLGVGEMVGVIIRERKKIQSIVQSVPSLEGTSQNAMQ
jgi:hypothetical protein